MLRQGETTGFIQAIGRVVDTPLREFRYTLRMHCEHAHTVSAPVVFPKNIDEQLRQPLPIRHAHGHPTIGVIEAVILVD